MGGNVFKNTSPILRENIKPTLERFFSNMTSIFPEHKHKFTLEYFVPIGSTGKKPCSEDIDLAVDISTFYTSEYNRRMASWGIDEVEFLEKVNLFKKRSRTSTISQNKQRAFITLLGDKINSYGGEIKVHEVKSNGNMFIHFPQVDVDGNVLDSFVQIDLMIGKLDWLVFSYYSLDYLNNIKGLHRTQLILAMFANKNKVFNHTSGVKDKTTNEIEAETPDEAIKLLNSLYNIKINEQIITNYCSIQKYLQDNVSNITLGEIYDIYLKTLDSTRCDIPYDLQLYWKQNKDRLNLTGKFLPKESELLK